jgi:hypothetical protein
MSHDPVSTGSDAFTYYPPRQLCSAYMSVRDGAKAPMLSIESFPLHSEIFSGNKRILLSLKGRVRVGA